MTRAMRDIALPHGVLRDGRVDRAVALRAPTGADEQWVLDRDDLTLPERLSRLLERCVLRIGGRRSSPRLVRELVSGDREALALQLRALAFGDRLACVLDCPACREAMDLDLSVDDLLVASYANPSENHEVTLSDGCRVRFRLPTGVDLEAVAGAEDVDEGVSALLERCVSTVELERRVLTGLTPDQRAELDGQMARLDPQAEIRLNARCPECGEEFAAMLDAAGLLLDELAGDRDALDGEIHAIALRYHWSEAEILALEVTRRRRYLELLADSSPAASWASA